MLRGELLRRCVAARRAFSKFERSCLAHEAALLGIGGSSLLAPRTAREISVARQIDAPGPIGCG
ncbi:MAG TPA: hypothetical protein VGK73_28665, partial [Polyangiaceae bacterium]